jgi:hypothetical protein
LASSVRGKTEIDSRKTRGEFSVTSSATSWPHSLARTGNERALIAKRHDYGIDFNEGIDAFSRKTMCHRSALYKYPVQIKCKPLGFATDAIDLYMQFTFFRALVIVG